MNEGSFFYNNCQETYVVVSRYTISIMSSRRNSLYDWLSRRLRCF